MEETEKEIDIVMRYSRSTYNKLQILFRNYSESAITAISDIVRCYSIFLIYSFVT